MSSWIKMEDKWPKYNDRYYVTTIAGDVALVECVPEYRYWYSVTDMLRYDIREIAAWMEYTPGMDAPDPYISEETKAETVADHLKTLSSNQDIAFMVMQWIAEYAYKYCKDDGELWALRHVVATAEFGMQIEKDLGEPYKGSKFDRENKEEKENGEE